jgi:hypothetical protein
MPETAGTPGQEGDAKKFGEVVLDSAAAANQSYDIYANVTSTLSATVPIYLYIIVINFASASEVALSPKPPEQEVAVANGTTVTVNSVSVSAGKYVIVCFFDYRQPDTTERTLGAGNVRLKLNGTLLAATEYAIKNRYYSYPLDHNGLLAVASPTASSTITLEVYNDTGNTIYVISTLVAFPVNDYQFLDTGSVAIGTTETTIGSLNVTLAGKYAVIAVLTVYAAVGNDIAAGNARLKADTTVKDSNIHTWHLQAVSPFYPNGMALFDIENAPATISVTAIAPATGLYGEVKLAAFSIVTPLSFSDTVSPAIEDTYSVSIPTPLSFGDTVGPTIEDTYSVSIALPLSFGDTVSPTIEDSYSVSISVGLTFSDTISSTIEDSYSIIVLYPEIFRDTISPIVEDSYSIIILIPKSFRDTINVAVEDSYSVKTVIMPPPPGASIVIYGLWRLVERMLGMP